MIEDLFDLYEQDVFGLRTDIENIEKNHLPNNYHVHMVQLTIDGRIETKTFYLIGGNKQVIRLRKTTEGFYQEGYEIPVKQKMYRYDMEGNLQKTYTFIEHGDRDKEPFWEIRDRVERDDGQVYYYSSWHGVPQELNKFLGLPSHMVEGWAYKDGAYSVYLEAMYWRKDYYEMEKERLLQDQIYEKSLEGEV